MKIEGKILLTFLLTMGLISCFSQDVHYQQYTEADGLPSMTIYEIVQDSAGILWMGTENGVVSSDGVEFTTYIHPDLKDNDIISIFLSKDGHILFLNLSNQLCEIKDGKINILLSLNSENNYGLLSTKTKDYIFESEKVPELISNRFYEINNNELKLHLNLETKVPIIDSNYIHQYIYSIAYPLNRIFYLVENDSIVFFVHKSRERHVEKKTEEFEFYVEDFSFAKLFNFGWSKDRHLALLANNRAYYIDKSLQSYYKNNDIQRIVRFENRCYIILKDRLELVDLENSIRKLLVDDKIVNTVFEDRENNIWVSTRENGLLKITNQNFKLLSFKNEEQIISGVYATDKHVLILWGDKFGIRNRNNENVIEFDLETNKKSVVINKDNGFYIMSKRVLYKIMPPEFFKNEGLTATAPKAIVFRNSTMYVSTNESIFRYEDVDRTENINFQVSKSRIDFKNAYSLHYSPSKDLLLAGSPKGLYKIDHNNDYSIYVDDLASTNICDIEESKDSSFWIGTKNKGAYQIKDERIINHFDTSNGLLSNVVNDICLHDGFVYVATTNGIAQINTVTYSVINRNSANGLPSDNIKNICSFNDSLWLTIQKEIVILEKSFFNTTDIPPVLSLDQFYGNNEIIDFQNGVQFNYDQNKIDILLKNVSFNSGSNKSIKYRIINIDTTWTFSKESAIRLPALQPGNYVVEAFGINAVGTESNALSISFVINPPWWDTIWAMAVGISILFLIGYLVIRYRSRRIRKEEALKRDYLNQINKIKDQALQLQMNPHFIFNSLNAIQGFIGTDEEEKAMNFLARFARLIRLIFEHSKGNTITLEEELEFIHLYLDLEKLRFKDKVDIEVTIDSEIESNKDMIYVPPLLIQPIVENSFKHGLFHKKDQGHLSIDYKIESELLKVVIQDNGIGRDASRRLALKNGEKQTSSGISTTKERIELLNFGEKENRNSISIEDLFNKDGTPAGTKTVLHFSLKTI